MAKLLFLLPALYSVGERIEVALMSGGTQWYNVVIGGLDEKEFFMRRPKKNGTYINVCIDTPVYQRLEEHCLEAGHTKTVVVQRAIIEYLDNYDKRQQILKQIEISPSGTIQK